MQNKYLTQHKTGLCAFLLEVFVCVLGDNSNVVRWSEEVKVKVKQSMYGRIIGP
jgi:hypothetical protein